MALDTSKRTLYHSSLVQEGEVTVTIVGEKPQKSKYQGKPDWIGFKYNGHDLQYNVENERCGEALTGLKGKTVRLIAHGSRDDASIEILDNEAAAGPSQPQRQQTQTTQAPAKTPPKAPATPEDRDREERKAYNGMRRMVAQTALLLENSLKATRAAFHRSFPEASADAHAFDTRHMDAIERAAVSVFIEAKSLITISALPTKAPEGNPPPAKAAPPPPPPPPEPEPEPDLADDDIAF